VGGRGNAPAAVPQENVICRHFCSSNCHAFCAHRACVRAYDLRNLSASVQTISSRQIRKSWWPSPCRMLWSSLGYGSSTSASRRHLQLTSSSPWLPRAACDLFLPALFSFVVANNFRRTLRIRLLMCSSSNFCNVQSAELCLSIP